MFSQNKYQYVIGIHVLYAGWRKPKSDHEEDSPNEVNTLENQTSKSDSTFHRHGLKGKMSFKTASQATLTFLSARRRIEGGLKSLAKKAQKAEHTKGILVVGCNVVFAWLLIPTCYRTLELLLTAVYHTEQCVTVCW